MSNDFWQEVFRLVDEYDAARPQITIEHRLYYNAQDGTVTGYCETAHPDDKNYIVLENPDIYFRNNTNLLRVKNGKLIVIDPKQPSKARLKKSTDGYKTVKGHASLLLESTEDYHDIEHYDHTND
jgi:hypothetical protein